VAQQAEVAVHARQAAEVQHVGEEELSHGLVDIPSSNIYIYISDWWFGTFFSIYGE